MKLGSKTFLYSVIISLIVGIVIFSYMVFLMPSMYMDYKENQNLENAKSAMKHFKKHESLKNFKTGDANTYRYHSYPGMATLSGLRDPVSMDQLRRLALRLKRL